MEKYGIRGHPLKLFRSYLENRTQAVRYKKSISEYKIIKVGIPQGTILGPLLFLIYVNDISNFSDTCTSILYADDTRYSLF